jgi:hypothetical protein
VIEDTVRCDTHHTKSVVDYLLGYVVCPDPLAYSRTGLNTGPVGINSVAKPAIP